MTEKRNNIIDTIRASKDITKEQLKVLLAKTEDTQTEEYLRKTAQETARRIYGNQVFVRGLIEFTNYCRCDCRYCGIRRSNKNVSRYRLTPDQIMNCCKAGYELGFRTFVLQGGEDPYFTDQRMVELIRTIKGEFPDCALTLSIGERVQGELRRLPPGRSGPVSAAP